MKFIDNGIEFTNVLEPGIEVESAPIGMLNNYSYSDNNLDITKGNKYIVNAIDIDWNGAKVNEDTTINTTGELISWINSKSSDDCPECVVSNEKFELKATTDLSENNILLLFVKDEETPIFQIGGTNSKIQKSMLSDELKNFLGNKTNYIKFDEYTNIIKNSGTATTEDSLVINSEKNLKFSVSGDSDNIELLINNHDEEISTNALVSSSVGFSSEGFIDSDKGFKVNRKTNNDILLAGGSTKPLSEIVTVGTTVSSNDDFKDYNGNAESNVIIFDPNYFKLTKSDSGHIFVTLKNNN